MKYMLLIHQGDTPTPHNPEEWARLSEDEQNAVYAAYQEIDQTPGVTPGVQMQPAEAATTVRVEDGKTLTTDGPFVAVKEARSHRACPRPAWAAPSRCARSWSTSDPRAGLPR